MRNITTENTPLIEAAYRCHRQSLLVYFHRCIDDMETCQDLAQDVFLRLMEYSQMVRPTTIRHFIFAIARNLMRDYLRHFYIRQEVTSYIYDSQPAYTPAVEEQMIADELQALEQKRVARLPQQRRTVYLLARYEGKNAREISEQMGLSLRTVNNHLYISRKEVREYIRQCI
ncbi:MAG: sigma-70 family RNA polymerase sigma factor [Bacteroides sp.]